MSSFNVFLDEVCTQGDVLRACLDKYYGVKHQRLTEVFGAFKQEGYKRILLVGMGSSFYAARCVAGYLSGSGIPCTVLNAYDVAAFNFAHVTAADTLLVCISQSGKSWEVVKVAEMAKKKGITVVGIYNREGSPLSKLASYHILIHAGEERFISNKSYLCTLTVLNLFAHGIGGGLNDSLKQELYAAADWISEWLDNWMDRTNPVYEFSKGSVMYDFIADGPSFSTAGQSGLIYREGPKVYSGASETADYAHGLNLCANNGYCGFMLSPAYESEAEKRMVEAVTKSGGKIVLLTAKNISESEIKSENMFVIKLPKLRDSLMPLTEIIPLNTLMGIMMGKGWTR